MKSDLPFVDEHFLAKWTCEAPSPILHCHVFDLVPGRIVSRSRMVFQGATKKLKHWVHSMDIKVQLLH